MQLHIDAAHALLKKGAAYRDFVPAGTDDPKDHSETKVAWTSNPGERERSVEDSDRLAAEGKPFVIRFRVPRENPKGVAFKDMVFGKQFRKYADMEDFALLRSDGNPTYHLASCVDDGDLKITDILRGQDHLTNTFKHVLIFEALGYETPNFGHMPLLLGPDQSKLSKRKHGPIVSVVNYRDAGFLPQAFINFISLLGWSSKDNQEVFTLDELLAKFDAKDILRTNSIVQFDENDPVNWAPPKAVWLNGQHLRTMPVEKLIKYVKPELVKAGWWKDEFEGDPEILKKIDAIRSRFNMLGEFQQRGAAYFCDEFPTEEKAVENLDKDNARELLRRSARSARRIQPRHGRGSPARLRRREGRQSRAAHQRLARRAHRPVRRTERVCRIRLNRSAEDSSTAPRRLREERRSRYAHTRNRRLAPRRSSRLITRRRNRRRNRRRETSTSAACGRDARHGD